MCLTLNDLLIKAQKNSYAIPAFNIYNLESIQAVAQAAEIERAAIIFGVSEKAIDYAGLSNIVAIIHNFAKNSQIKFVLHLDHGRQVSLIKKSIEAGFTSVMYDGSKLPLAENIRKTCEVVKFAHRYDVSVEGEVGTIGGQEDRIKNIKINLTNPQEVYQFVEKTGVDAVACGLGTSHGLPVPNEQVDFDLLETISAQVAIPLVLHGASNLPTKILKIAIKKGVVKINFDTELRQAFTSGVRQKLAEKDLYDPRIYLASGREQMMSEARKIIRLLGANNQV